MPGKPWIATAPLHIGYARAFNPGDVVPDGHVEEYGWGEHVAREGTKAANEAQGLEQDGPAQAPEAPSKP